jgi:hypothetical protein
MNTENMLRFETGISKNNLKHWGELEVVKEFVQNVVFASTILGDEISISHDGVKAIIYNTPHGFTKGKLLIGESEQSGVEGAPGEYGEGMKAAMAVARRLGLKLKIVTNGFTVHPELEPSSLDADVETLVFYIEDTDLSSGTTVELECSRGNFDTALSYFAVLNGVREEVVKTDTIIDEVKDTVFVNGVKITEIPSVFSYNFTDPSLMNRDRTSVDMTKVKTHVSKQLAKITDVGMASQVLLSILDKDSLLEAQSGIYEWEADHTLWRQAVLMSIGDKVCIATGTECDSKAMYHKFKVLTNVPSKWKYFFTEYLGVPESSHIESLRVKPKNVHRKPDADSSANLGWAKRLIKIYYADYGTVKVSDKVYDQFGNECLGTYEPGSDIIWISRGVLHDKKQTFTTLLHETVHKITGASDNTPGFVKGWEDASYGILMRGRLDG